MTMCHFGHVPYASLAISLLPLASCCNAAFLNLSLLHGTASERVLWQEKFSDLIISLLGFYIRLLLLFITAFLAKYLL